MSTRIADAFAALAAKGRKAFVPYITAGDPSPAHTAGIVCALGRAGADCIELGIPFSDPMADGPAIQDACGRALAAGASVTTVLEAVREARKHIQTPILLFTYLNPVLAYGSSRFAADAAAAGADGVLLLDLTPEAGQGFLQLFREHGLATVCLVAPNTGPERAAAVAAASRGFVYYVCRLGVTGERAELPADLAERVGILRAAAKAPVCVGFGISTPEQAAQAARIADGAVVGSHLVKLIASHGQDPQLLAIVEARARAFADAVHGVV